MAGAGITHSYSPQAVIPAALKCLANDGQKGNVAWLRPPDHVAVGTIDIVYQEPDQLTHMDHYQLHIWKDKRLAMSATWEGSSSGPYKALKLYPGQWIGELIKAAG